MFSRSNWQHWYFSFDASFFIKDSKGNCVLLKIYIFQFVRFCSDFVDIYLNGISNDLLIQCETVFKDS